MQHLAGADQIIGEDIMIITETIIMDVAMMEITIAAKDVQIHGTAPVKIRIRQKIRWIGNKLDLLVAKENPGWFTGIFSFICFSI
jgi:hypothetical protein